MGFGNKLKDILKRKGVTIKELSEITGISLNTLYSITKRDTQLPSEEIIKKIAIALEINETELLTYDYVKQQLSLELRKLNETENEMRKKLFEISEMLNIDAIAILLNQAIDLLQDDTYRTMFYKKTEDSNND